MENDFEDDTQEALECRRRMVFFKNELGRYMSCVYINPENGSKNLEVYYMTLSEPLDEVEN
jgi:hypothetical protein